ncbi:MAG: ribbon-helix-helix protein, CopG family [Prochloraceae cyanobacterium]|nr:ribbon-helix-helix protein, CopG family [Prochloraceae cyanobacterium]
MPEKQLHIRVTESEMKILERYAKRTQRTKSDIVREFIRSLKERKPS